MNHMYTARVKNYIRTLENSKLYLKLYLLYNTYEKVCLRLYILISILVNTKKKNFLILKKYVSFFEYND